MAAITAKEEAAKKTRTDAAMEKMKKPAGKLRSIRVEPADNGYSVHVDREQPAPANAAKGKGENMPTSYEPPKQSVFNNKADVLDHISNHLD